MAESPLHVGMKESVSRRLSEEGYEVFFEPAFAPSRFLRWASYRPDLIGIRAGPSRQEYVLVECETRPSTRKLSSKNFRSVEVRLRLNSRFSLRRVLVIPRGTLASVDSSVRLLWEVWIYDKGALQTFPKAKADGPQPPAPVDNQPAPGQELLFTPLYQSATIAPK